MPAKKQQETHKDEDKDELIIKGEPLSPPTETERTTPNLIGEFRELLVAYGLTEKQAETISNHIADTGSDKVFEKRS